jgi:hypothetical protein
MLAWSITLGLVAKAPQGMLRQEKRTGVAFGAEVSDARERTQRDPPDGGWVVSNCGYLRCLLGIV